MKVFTRSINVDFEENPDGSLFVKSHMEDMLHDILLEMVISRPDFVIQHAEVHMIRTPAKRCYEIGPAVKQLEGISVEPGFVRQVNALFKGCKGCPNVLNLVMVAAPLAINASWIADYGNGRISCCDVNERMEQQLEGVCIAHSNGHSE